MPGRGEIIMRRFILALILGVFVGSAHAALVSEDLDVSGDGLLTLDTETGLHWLNFSATKGFTANQVLVDTGGWLSRGF